MSTSSTSRPASTPSAANPSGPSGSSSRVMPNDASPDNERLADPDAVAEQHDTARPRCPRQAGHGRGLVAQDPARPHRDGHRHRSIGDQRPGRIRLDERHTPGDARRLGERPSGSKEPGFRSKPSAVASGHAREEPDQQLALAATDLQDVIAAPQRRPRDELVEPRIGQRPKHPPVPVRDDREAQRMADRRQSLYRSASSSDTPSASRVRTTSTFPTRRPSVVSTVSVSPSTDTWSPGFGTPPMRW